jgi:hypothetical protein
MVKDKKKRVGISQILFAAVAILVIVTMILGAVVSY